MNKGGVVSGGVNAGGLNVAPQCCPSALLCVANGPTKDPGGQGPKDLSRV